MQTPPLLLSNLPPETWAVVAAVIGILTLGFAVLRAGASTVRTNAKVAASVDALAKSVQKIEERVEHYITNEGQREDAVQTWRRAVEARLASIEATLVLFTHTGRRKTDR